jgi:NADPH2:quinone reductase
VITPVIVPPPAGSIGDRDGCECGSRLDQVALPAVQWTGRQIAATTIGKGPDVQAWIPTGRDAETIVLAEVDRPRPAPDEVVVSVEAYSINRGETFLLDAPRPRWRPGKDVAGTVIRAAADGGPEVGRRVVAHPEQGGWAQEVAVPVGRLAGLPDTVPATTAAALPLAGLTALRMVRVLGSLAGRRILLTGAAGGVGHYFTELAAAQGALVTAVVATPERGRRLIELGATELVDDVEKADGPFDIVVESVGRPTFAAAWSRLHERGLFLWLGQASRIPPTMDFFDWRGGSSATLRKFNYVDSDVPTDEDLATLVRLVDGGHLHPEIGRVEDWRQTPEVLRALAARTIRGNAVLTTN